MNGATTGTANMHRHNRSLPAQQVPVVAANDGILNALRRYRWNPYSPKEVKKAVRGHAIPAPPPPPQHADPTACIPSAVLDSGDSPVGLLPSPAPARHYTPTNANDSTLGRGALQDLTPDEALPHLSPVVATAQPICLATVPKRLIKWHRESLPLATKEEQRLSSHAAARGPAETPRPSEEETKGSDQPPPSDGIARLSVSKDPGSRPFVASLVDNPRPQEEQRGEVPPVRRVQDKKESQEVKTVGEVYVEAYFPEYGHARPSKAKKEGAPPPHPPAPHPPWNQISELLAKGVKTRVQAERPGLYGEDGHHRSRPLVVVHIPPFKGTRPSVNIAGYSSTEGTYRLVELRFVMFVKDRRAATATTTAAAAADGQEEGSDEISYLEGVVEAVLKGLVQEVVVAPA